MTPANDHQEFVTIPRDKFEELRAKDPPKWYKRHLTSLIVGGMFSLVTVIVGTCLDQRTGNRLGSMDSKISTIQDHINSTEIQLEGFAGQIKLMNDRIQSMGNRIQSMDNRLVKVQG